MVRALIFDLDGTLIDRQKAFKEFLRREFLNITSDESLINEMIKDIVIWDDFGRIPRSISFKKWEEKYKLEGITSKELDEKWKNESGKKCYLYDDVKDTLSKLKEKYKIGILTNGSPLSQRRKLDSINIYDLIDYSLISGEYEVSKPDTKIYKYVCSQMGFKEDECVYIGDTFDIDYDGAINAGLNAVFVNHKNEVHPEAKMIDNLSDLLKIY